MYEIYMLTCWYAFAAFTVLALHKRDWSLLRCAVVMALGQGLTDLWPGQPSLLFLGVYMLSALILLIKPRGELCSVMAALCLWGVAFSVMYNLFEWTSSKDRLYFTANLAIDWLSLFIMTGGAAYDTGQRCFSRIGDGISNMGLANRSRRQGSETQA